MIMDTRQKLMYLAIGLFIISVFVFSSISHNKESVSDNNKLTIINSVQTTTFSAKKRSATTVSKVKSTQTVNTTQKPNNTTLLSKTTATTEIVTEPLHININLASEEEFQLLHNIGPSIAGNIVRYRNENGEFNNIEEIMLVDGIGQAVFEEISPYIYVESPFYPEDDEDETAAEDTEDADESVEIVGEEALAEQIYPININTATKEELMLLPDFNETVADEVIRFREMAGGFRNINELLYIKSLTRSQAAGLKDYICFE